MPIPVLQKVQATTEAFYNQLHSYGSKTRTYANSLKGTGKNTAKRFVIFCQGRTGSTLLCNLIHKHPAIYCDQEILSKPRWRALHFVLGKRNRAQEVTLYGFKVKFYQLTNQQDIAPDRFVRTLSNRGWKVIYLWRRNVLRHSISGHMAAAKNLWHAKKNSDDQKSKVEKAVHIDPDALLRDAYQRRIWLKKERSALEGINFFEINYEDDLLTQDDRARTLPQLFDFLGVVPKVFQPDTVRTSKKDLSEQISNYAEVVDCVEKSPFKHMLP